MYLYIYENFRCHECDTETKIVSLIADCNGDELYLCDHCWSKYYKEHIFPLFHPTIDDICEKNI